MDSRTGKIIVAITSPSLRSWTGTASLALGWAFLIEAALWQAPLTLFHRWLVGIGIVVAFAAGAWGQRNRGRRDEEAQRVSELQLASLRAQEKYSALRTRLQPHFLFNTLHTISALIHIDEDRAESMVLALSDVLRSSLGEYQKEMPLASELDLLRKYLEIEWTRFNDRLQIDLAIDPKALPCLIPPLLLQPLVEYAVRTGVEKRIEPGLLKLAIRVENEELNIELGHDPGDPKIRRGQSNPGTLDEISSRLKAHYGDEHSVQVRHEAEGRQTIIIRLPQRLGQSGETSCD